MSNNEQYWKPVENGILRLFSSIIFNSPYNSLIILEEENGRDLSHT